MNEEKNWWEIQEVKILGQGVDEECRKEEDCHKRKERKFSFIEGEEDIKKISFLFSYYILHIPLVPISSLLEFPTNSSPHSFLTCHS